MSVEQPSTVEYTGAAWHFERRRRLEKKYPHLRKLCKSKDNLSFPLLVGLWSLELALVVAAPYMPVYVIVLLGLVVGQWQQSAMRTCMHNIFHFPFWKRWQRDAANIIFGYPFLNSSLSYDFASVGGHKEHHRHLGEWENDVTFREREGTWLIRVRPDGNISRAIESNSAIFNFFWIMLTKAVPYFFLGPFYWGRYRDPIGRLVLVSTIAHVALTWTLGGWKGMLLVYLFNWFFATFPFSPFSAFRVINHGGYTNDTGECNPTISMYNLPVWLMFGVANHVEHHDFPAMNHWLYPKLKEEAPEFYPSDFKKGWVHGMMEYLRNGKEWYYSCVDQ
jgi:fatty acid desaturase